MNGAFDNDEAVALNASGYNLQRLWTGKKLYASGRIGLGTNLRLNDHVAINFELNTNMLSDKFNSKKGVNADWQFNGLVGLSFTLGKSSRKVAPVSYEPEQPVSVTTVEQRPGTDSGSGAIEAEGRQNSCRTYEAEYFLRFELCSYSG